MKTLAIISILIAVALVVAIRWCLSEKGAPKPVNGLDESERTRKRTYARSSYETFIPKH